MRIRPMLTAALCLLVTAAAHAATVFTFDSEGVNKPLPLSETVNGVTATFTGNGGICPSSGLSGPMFSTLSGNVLMQNFCVTNGTGPITVAFSQSISSLSFNFVTQNGPGTITVAYYSKGAQVATRTFNSAIPNGFLNGEGVSSFSASFESVVISSSLPLALDNFSVAGAGIAQLTYPARHSGDALPLGMTGAVWPWLAA